MPPTRDEYLALLGLKAKPRPVQNVEFDVLKTAAVSFEHLTNSPEWDRFLSYVQAAYETAKRERDAWSVVCLSEASDINMRDAQMKYHWYTGQCRAYESMLELPNKILIEYTAEKDQRQLGLPEEAYGH